MSKKKGHQLNFGTPSKLNARATIVPTYLLLFISETIKFCSTILY